VVSRSVLRDSSPEELVSIAPALREPLGRQLEPRESVANVEQRYDRAGLWVAIVVTFGWQLAGVAPVVVQSLLRYGLAASGAVTWLVFTALGAAAAAVVSRGGGHSLALPFAVCPILLAGSVVGSLMAPDGVIGHFNWQFAVAGWFAVLALWRRRLTELLSFYAANVLAGGVILAVAGEANRISVGRFIALCCGISALQITVFAGARMVTAMARRAAQAEDELARTRSAHIAAEAVQAARRVRYEMITGTVAHLLEGLATDQLDLGGRDARQQVAVAVTRLRRYLVESDDVPDRLWHELRACADAAERQGIAVDLVAPAGQVPQLPLDVRRALTEPIISALAATAAKARITVIAYADQVAVAILADAQPISPVPCLHEAVECSHDADGELLWVQARWTEPSASPSSRTPTSSSRACAAGSQPTRTAG
jgi:hypothetical protein